MEMEEATPSSSRHRETLKALDVISRREMHCELRFLFYDENA